MDDDTPVPDREEQRKEILRKLQRCAVPGDSTEQVALDFADGALKTLATLITMLMAKGVIGPSELEELLP